MRQIINVPYKEKPILKEIEDKIRSARLSNDYVLITFNKESKFIKVAFSRDQTYTVGYNFLNMEFSIKLNMFMRQYSKTVNSKLAKFIYDWVSKLNR